VQRCQQRGRDRSSIQGGSLRALRGHRKAARGLLRSADAHEAGVPGYEAGPGTAPAPAGTPQAIVASCKAIVRLWRSRSARAPGERGRRGDRQPPEAFAAHITAELARMGKLIRDADIRME